MTKKEFKILSPTAILGYGFSESSFMRGIGENPDLIAVNAGSVDPGPYYLGAGKSFTNYKMVKNDLSHILKEAIPRNIPVMIGTAGGCGAEPHLKWCEQIIREIVLEEKPSFKMAKISSDIDKKYLHNALQDGRIQPLSHDKPLTEQAIKDSSYIVAQMGVEPFIEAIN